MEALALAAAAAPATDWVARWLAIGGLVVSIGSICVTVILWKRDGWRLYVGRPEDAAEGDPKPADEGPPNTPHQRRVAVVTNVGRMACKISAKAEARTSTSGSSPWAGGVSLANGSTFPYTLEPTESVRLVWYTNSGNQMRVIVTVGRRSFSSNWTDY